MQNKDNIFYNTLNQLAIGLMIIDDNYRIVFFNQWLSDSSDFISEEVEGKKISEVFTSYEESRLSDACHDALTFGLPTKLSTTFNQSPLPLYQKHHIGNSEFLLSQHISVKKIMILIVNVVLN